MEVTSIGEKTALAGAAFALPIIAIVAGALTLTGSFIGGGATAFVIERVVTVLVIACPHALGLPVASLIPNVLAARRRIAHRIMTPPPTDQ